METAFQRPIVASIFQSLLLGIATSVGIAVKESLDETTGSLSNFVYFAVIVAVHFGILTVLVFMLGYGGGMISGYPVKRFRDRFLWWIHGDLAFQGENAEERVERYKKVTWSDTVDLI